MARKTDLSIAEEALGAIFDRTEAHCKKPFLTVRLELERAVMITINGMAREALEKIEAARRARAEKRARLAGAGGGPPYDAATATGMYDRDF